MGFRLQKMFAKSQNKQYTLQVWWYLEKQNLNPFCKFCYFSIMKRIKIKIEDGQADKLYKIAEDKKENVSLLIRQAIDDYIKKKS